MFTLNLVLGRRKHSQQTIFQLPVCDLPSATVSLLGARESSDSIRPGFTEPLSDVLRFARGCALGFAPLTSASEILTKLEQTNFDQMTRLAKQDSAEA